MFISEVLIIAITVQILCQLSKVVIYSVKTGRFGLKYFVSAGGIPSSHTAFVTALTVAIGMKKGFSSDLFAISCVFSVIVIYDAFRLRGVVEEHSKLLNNIMKTHFPGQYKQQNEMVGHSLLEIGVGIIIGSVYSFIISTIFLSVT